MTTEILPVTARLDTNWLALVGRLLLASIFVVSGLRKLADMTGTAAYMAANGIPVPNLLVPPAIMFEVGGGLLLAIGLFTRWTALVLMAWTCVLAIIFHPFWSVDPKVYGLQLTLFLFHLETAGGFVYIIAYGSGRFSVDQRRAGTS